MTLVLSSHVRVTQRRSAENESTDQSHSSDVTLGRPALVGGNLGDGDQAVSDVHTIGESVPSNIRAVLHAITTEGSPGTRTHEATADLPSTSVPLAPDLRGYAELRLLAESFEDAQKARIAIENRLRSGADAGPALEALDSLRHAEGKLSLALRRKFRVVNPELTAWAKDTVGIGEHLLARLIGTIGHPVIASPYHWEGEGSDRILVSGPSYLRSVSQLWSYCGHGDPTRKRRKGMTADEAMSLGNPRAKMLVHLIAEGCVKCRGSATGDSDSSRAGGAIECATPEAGSPTSTTLSAQTTELTVSQAVALGSDENDDETRSQTQTILAPVRRRSPYRDTYDLARITYSEREDWSDGHRHNAALRLVGKEVLRDIWLVAQTPTSE